MYKKFAVIVAMIILSNTVYAADFSVKYDDFGLTISGETEKTGENVNVTVWDKNNELLYVDQVKCEDSTNFEFKVGVLLQNGLKIKVGGSDEYSPFMQMIDDVKDYNTYYVSSGVSQNGDGTKENPFSSLSSAYNAASAGDMLYILGDAQWDIDAESEKAISISGGKLIFSDNNTVNTPLAIKDIQVEGTEITADNIVIGENVNFSSFMSLVSDYAEIHSGNYNNVSGKVIRLCEGIENITVSSADVVIIEDAEYNNISAGFIINNGSGGNAEYKDGKVYITPTDGRYVSINRGDYKRSDVIETQGTYNIVYDYDFKLHSAEVSYEENGYMASVEISAYNRNKEEEKSNPVLIAAVYDENSELQFIKSEQIETGATVKTDMLLGEVNSESVRVKFYLWDSFKNMCPLTEMISQRNKDKNELVYYVSPDGDDSGSGSYAEPFKTIEKAVETVENEEIPVTVKIKSGTYKVNSEIVVDGDNVSFIGEENAVISTGYEIPGSAFGAADEAFLSQLVDESVKDKIVAVSLEDVGITDYGAIYDYAYNSKDTAAPVLNQDNQRMQIAMYPDNGYLKIGDVAEGGDGTTPMKINVSGGRERVGLWKSGEVYADGYMCIEWRDSRAKVTISENNNDYIFTAFDETLEVVPASGQRVRFINVPEEITKPGEWYLNRDTGVLYIYPYEGFSEKSTITFNPCKPEMNSVFLVKDASKISFSDLTFKNIGTNVFDIESSENITIKSCEFTDISGDGVVMSESEECLIKDNYLHHVSGGGFEISGGDSANLIKANNYITNNIMHDFSIDRRTYTPAVSMSGCGNVISHNEIYNAPHMAMSVGGMEFIVEYNEIYDVCRETADSGAIYAGRHPQFRNNVIRYNYFHDISQEIDTGYAVVTVYFDDLWSAADVNSNIFYNVDRAGLIGGGRDSGFKNNIFMNCGASVAIDSRGERYVGAMEAFRETDIYRNIFYSPFRSAIWRKEFPEIYDMFENPGTGYDAVSFAETTLKDEAFLPAGNSINENVFINTNSPSLSGSAEELTEVEGNIRLTTNEAKNIFSSYENQYFNVKAGSLIFDMLPDFDAPEFDKIGVQR